MAELSDPLLGDPSIVNSADAVAVDDDKAASVLSRRRARRTARQLGVVVSFLSAVFAGRFVHCAIRRICTLLGHPFVHASPSPTTARKCRSDDDLLDCRNNNQQRQVSSTCFRCMPTKSSRCSTRRALRVWCWAWRRSSALPRANFRSVIGTHVHALARPPLKVAVRVQQPSCLEPTNNRARAFARPE